MEITLGDFVRFLVLLLHKNGIALPFNNRALFHKLFYRLKIEVNVAKPKFLEKLDFDWDGPYPESLDLAMMLHALRWADCVETNSPRFDRFWLSAGIEMLWKEKFDKTDEVTKQYLNSAVNLAREEFKSVL